MPVRLHSIAGRRWLATVASDRRSRRIAAFKGIGRYTAAAIASFAYRHDAPILDTNVRRVLFRIFVDDGDLVQRPAERRLWRVSPSVVLPKGRAWEFNSALMDFGALVSALPAAPMRAGCPMTAFCRYRKKHC